MSGSKAEVSPEVLRSVSTPDRVDSRIGMLEFDDGAPFDKTAALLYDHLDFVNGVQAFLRGIPGASLGALRRDFRSVGAEDNSFGKTNNWLQTIPGKGWLYNPLQPFFDKTWRPSEIEPI